MELFILQMCPCTFKTPYMDLKCTLTGYEETANGELPKSRSRNPNKSCLQADPRQYNTHTEGQEATPIMLLKRVQPGVRWAYVAHVKTPTNY